MLVGSLLDSSLVKLAHTLLSDSISSSSIPLTDLSRFLEVPALPPLPPASKCSIVWFVLQDTGKLASNMKNFSIFCLVTYLFYHVIKMVTSVLRRGVSMATNAASLYISAPKQGWDARGVADGFVFRLNSSHHHEEFNQQGPKLCWAR